MAASTFWVCVSAKEADGSVISCAMVSGAQRTAAKSIVYFISYTVCLSWLYCSAFVQNVKQLFF